MVTEHRFASPQTNVTNHTNQERTKRYDCIPLPTKSATASNPPLPRMTQSYHPPPAPIFNTLPRIRRSPGAASFTGCASDHAVFRQATRSSFRRSSRLLNDHFRFVVAGRSVSIGAQTKGGSGTRGQVPSSQPTSTVFLLPVSRGMTTQMTRGNKCQIHPNHHTLNSPRAGAFTVAVGDAVPPASRFHQLLTVNA